jgi:Tol biopolymer transport system component
VKHLITFSLIVAGLVGPATGQQTSRVSVATGGAQGDGDSEKPSVSADGRYVAFASEATNFVSGDTNATFDVFVRDSQSSVTECVSVASDGTLGIHGGSYPSISADGRYVAFHSYSANLVGGDTNNQYDVFVRDRQSGVTERVSIATGGGQGDGTSEDPSISADGRDVAFMSLATNLVGGDTNSVEDIFVHDRQSGTTERVSISTGGAQGNGNSALASISADGRYVAFNSEASNLVGGDTNAVPDTFVRDRQSGTTVRVSVSSGGAEGNGGSGGYTGLSISADGRYVAFWSDASNLVAGDTNGVSDIFVHDLQSGVTERMSVDSVGAEGNDYSSVPKISGDGRYVAFGSAATNLVGGDTNLRYDVFVHDRQSGVTERVSVATDGSDANTGGAYPSSSTDGRYVAFWSLSPNLVDGDTNGFADIFVRDREVGTKYCIANANSTGSSADLSAFGSASSGAGDLTLTSLPVPNQFGIFFHGMNQSQNPFGNGFMCTTGGIVRGAVVLGVGNVATYTYDNSDAKHSLGGFVSTTRNFQHWFRDPMGGGAFFNTSNAVSILIEP